MTIAIAIACRDGVVLASDSMGSTARIATRVSKVRCLEGTPIAWATAGSEFMIQALENAISEERGDLATPIEVADGITPVLKSSLAVPHPNREQESPAHQVEALLVGWNDDQPSIIHLPADLATVECAEKRFIAIGSAHDFAHVVRETLSHHFGGPLTVEQGKLLAYRIVATVCSVSSWGVAMPVQMASVDIAGSSMISSDELEQIDAGVQRWMASESQQFAENGLTSAEPFDVPAEQFMPEQDQQRRS